MKIHTLITNTMSAAVFLAPVTMAAAEEAHHAAEHHSAAQGHHGPNIIEFFAGTTIAEHNGNTESSPSIGASYRYAFSPKVSAGLLAEYAGGSLDYWVVGAPIVFHVGQGGWQLTAMPGAEISSGHTEFLFRTAVGYDFEMDGYSIKPEIGADFVDGHATIILGVNLGFRF